jgi:hypothetical protein
LWLLEEVFVIVIEEDLENNGERSCLIPADPAVEGNYSASYLRTQSSPATCSCCVLRALRVIVIDFVVR